jgi:hypothetical protein
VSENTKRPWYVPRLRIIVWLVLILAAIAVVDLVLMNDAPLFSPEEMRQENATK